MASSPGLPGLSVGLIGTCRHVVNEQDTSRAVGTGETDLLSTPRVLAILERAARDAIADFMPQDLTTVAVRVELEHLLHASVGEVVTATATLVGVRGRRLTFAGRVHDSQDRAISVGRLTRAVVDIETLRSVT